MQTKKDGLLAVRHICSSHNLTHCQKLQKSLSALPYDSTRFRTGRKVLIHLDSFKINPTYNTDGAMGNCLQQPGQLLYQLKKFMRETTSQLIKLCTVTIPAAETKSIGLPADALLSWFLHRHQDSFIVT